MGEVFLCHDSRLHRKVALKCLTGDEPADAQAGILREARAVARLTHPHIASVYDVLEHDGRSFIVMEYVEGESLRARLSHTVLSPDQTIAIGRQLAAALSAAHAQGVIHRDLKPSNVQLTPDGTVKVLDFGVAKMTPRLDLTDDPTTTICRRMRDPTRPARRPIWRRSSWWVGSWTCAPTSTASASCCSRWPPGGVRTPRATRPRSRWRCRRRRRRRRMRLTRGFRGACRR
jgi:serine/threonine protein kinase